MSRPLCCRILVTALLLTAGAAALGMRVAAFDKPHNRVLGLNKVVAFTYYPNDHFDPRQLHSVTFLGPTKAEDWKYWTPRGVVAGAGHTWFDLLHSPLDKAVENLLGQDAGGNPHPVIMVDEFGFDYGGLMDQKSAQILSLAKRQKPDLRLAVFEMRGPIPPVLASAYRDTTDLVMTESYVGGVGQYWLLACQLWSARKFGILPKTIAVLGVGKGGNPGENWADSKEELERQMRFVRMIAPESPGIGFFAGTPELLADADDLAARYFRFPKDGAGLPPEALDLGRTFTRSHARPTLVVSPSFVEPNYTEDGKGIAKPTQMRVYIINLGDADAHDVKVRLRNPPNAGDNVFASGVVSQIPARDATIGILTVTDVWRVWVGSWVLEVDAPGCDVLTYKPQPPAPSAK